MNFVIIQYLLVEEGLKVEEDDMGYKDGKLVVVLVVVMVYMDD